jgi:hypothetical protein
MREITDNELLRRIGAVAAALFDGPRHDHALHH